MTLTPTAIRARGSEARPCLVRRARGGVGLAERARRVARLVELGARGGQELAHLRARRRRK